MKTKNEVLLLVGSMWQFFRVKEDGPAFWKMTNLLTDEENYILLDIQRNVHEELYSN